MQQLTLPFKNENFVIVEKPAGWLTTPSRMGAQDPRPCLGRELEKQLGCRVWPVHRLDEEVGGLVLFGLTAEAHKIANTEFELGHVSKFYEGWTEGTVPAAWSEGHQDIWRSKMLRGKKRAYFAGHGKEAITEATWLGEKEFEGSTAQKWLLEPITGRSHQLRLELASREFPIVGDSLYGSKRTFAENAIALRAVELDFSECEALLKLGLPRQIRSN